MSDQELTRDDRMQRFYHTANWIGGVLLALIFAAFLLQVGACTTTGNPTWWDGKRYEKDTETISREKTREVKSR